MKNSIIAAALLLTSGSAFAGISVGTEMSGLAALGLVGLVVGAQIVSRRKK